MSIKSKLQALRETIQSRVGGTGVMSFKSMADRLLEVFGVPKLLEDVPTAKLWYEDHYRLKAYEVPEGTKRLADDNQVLGNAQLASVVLPNTLEYIGVGVFDYQNSLTEIALPDSIRFLGKRPEEGEGWGSPGFNEKLTTVTGNTPALEWVGSRFFDHTRITSFRSDSSQNIRIGYEAFASNPALTTVGFPNGSIDYIGKYAFSKCPLLKSVNMSPSTDAVLDDFAFYGCTALLNAEYFPHMRSHVFYECTGIKTINLPASIKTAGSDLFRDCTGLTTATLIDFCPEDKCIPSGLLDGCSLLTGTTINENITKIRDYAFRGTAIQSLPFTLAKNSLTWIDKGAFANTNLLSVRGDVDMPNVHYIEAEAFQGCTKLTRFEFPAGVTYVRSQVLSGCTELENLVLSDGTEIIMSYAFYGCTSLRSVTIPAAVKAIDSTAFSGCSNIAFRVTGVSADVLAGFPWGATGSWKV